jgi:translation elongation factor EF-1alpha
VNLVIVGHVDHGKSTLIGQLFCDAFNDLGTQNEIKW